MATRKTIAEMMVILTTVYPSYDTTKDTVRVYTLLLADISDDLLMAAAQHHAATSKWFPKPAELREAALNIQARAQGIRTPEEAWIEVQKAVARYGSYGESIPLEEGGGWRVPTMLDALAREAIVGLGGWRVLCQSDNAIADRAHFMKLYGALLERRQEATALLPQVRKAVAEIEGARAIT
jgi:hypothetical protein